MAGNGVNLGVGIDLSQFQKDISYVNKALKDVSAQQAVIGLKLNIPKGDLKKEFESAQKGLKESLGKVQNIQINGSPIKLDNIKDAEKALRVLTKELNAAKKVGDQGIINSKSSDIANINQYIDALGRMSNAMAKVGLSSSSKSSAINKSDRAELDRQIKQLEKRRELIRQDFSLSSKNRLNEEQKILSQIIRLLERREATYKSGSSKAGQARIQALRNEQKQLENQQGVFGRLTNLASRYFSIYYAFDIAKQIFNTTKELQRQEVALRGIVGSAAEATKAMNGLKAMALESPFNLQDLIGYTKQLSAYGIAVEELLPTTDKLADLSAGLGVDMSRLILAYGQVNAASVLRGQELRQFTEAGIPMVEKLADKFTDLNGRLVTTGEVFDMISKRQVSFEMVSQVLSDMTSEGGEFYQMQDNLTDTLYGQFEKLKDTWTISLKNIGKDSESVFRGVLDVAMQLSKGLKGMIWGALIASAIKFGGAAQGAFSGAIGLVKNFVRGIKKASVAGNGLAFAIRSVGRALKSNLALAAIAAITSAIVNAIGRSREWKKSLDEINDSFAKDTAKMTSGLDALLGRLKVAGENSKEFADAMSALKANYGDYINENTIDSLVAEAKAAEDTAKSWGALAESIKETIRQKQEYERLNSVADLSIDTIIADIKDGFSGANSDNFDFDKNILGDIKEDVYSMDNTGHQTYIRTESEISDERLKKIEQVTIGAVSQFLNDVKGGEAELTSEELKHYLKDYAETKGFTPAEAEAISAANEQIFRDMNDGGARKALLELRAAAELLTDTFENKVKTAFESVGEDIEENYKSYRGERGKSSYDPYGTDKTAQGLYIKKLRELVLEQLSSEQKEQLSEREDFQSAISLPDGDYNKGKAIADSLRKFISDLPEEESKLIAHLNSILDNFISFAGTLDQTAANIRTNASEKRGFEGMNLSADDLDMIFRYTNITEQNKEEMRNTVANEIEKREKTIKEKGGLSNYKDEVKLAKEELKIFNVLKSDLYYGIKDKDKSSGGQQREAISPEFSDFINSFKNAYSTYKDAIQKGGIGIGLGYVRNDEQFQEMFGQFFNGVGGDQFQKLMNVKIGEKGDTTVGQTIQDKFLSGAEEGILDFESAALAVAKELEDYYNSEEKMKPYRKDYLNAAKELKRWVYSTVAKDNLAAALEEFEEGLKDITKTFENTNKSVETYRKLMEQGTAGRLGGQLGVSESEVLRPQSARQKDFISHYIVEFNEALKKFDGTKPFTLGSNALNNPAEVLKAIGKIDEVQRMNANNFKSNELGSKSEQLRGMLKQLVDMMHQEMADISGQSVTGDIMADAIKNIAISRSNAEYIAGTKQMKAESYGLIDANAINTLLSASKEEAQAFFDAFMSKEENQMTLDALEHGIDKNTFLKKFDDEVTRLEEILGEIPEHLRIELELKRKEVEDKIDKANVEYGKLGFGDEIAKYREASTWAEDRKTSLNNTIATNKLNLINAESDLDELRPMVNSGEATDEQLARYNELIQKANEYRASIKAANDELRNVDVRKQEQQLNALNSMKEKTERFGNKLNQLQDNFVAVFDAIKSCVDTFGKFYDMANDGENPKWIEDTSAVMGDFIENFKSAIAPILGVVAAITAVITIIIVLKSVCAELMIVFVAIIAIAAIFAAVFAAIQQHDRNLEHSIESLKKQVEEFEDAAERLNSVAERMTGIEKLKTQIDALGQSLSSTGAYAEMARLEEEKKDTDEEKVKEYEKQALEASEEFKNGIKQILDELIGATEDWSSAMSDAIRSAFQNGENAARSFRSSIKEMMGDVVQSMLEMAILQPVIEDILQDWTSSDALKQKYTKNVTITDENGNQVTVPEFDSEGYVEELLSNINDPEKAEDAYNSMQNAGEAYIDAVENLPDFLKDAFRFSSDTSSLSGGISGITEDTARQLEGLGNSQLMQLILINRTLSQYLDNMDNYSQSQYMANVQTHLQQINSNVRLILRSINELRHTTSKPLHVTVV